MLIAQQRFRTVLNRSAPSKTVPCEGTYSLFVAESLNATFPERWIRRGGPLGCPPRSPDITPCDFVVWGYVKELVCRSQISNKDELKTKISEDFGNI